jgi:hypothetical protein
METRKVGDQFMKKALLILLAIVAVAAGVVSHRELE